MGSWWSHELPQIQNKKRLTSEDLKHVAESQDPFIQLETYPPGDNPQKVFLDTSMQKILYGQPIGAGQPIQENLSTVWIVTESQMSRCMSGFGPWIISNVTTPNGQAQPTQQIATNTYDIRVLPTSSGEEFLWNTEFKAGKCALYYDKPGVGKLYALPVKSDDPYLSPPRDTLIQAVLADPSKQDVFAFTLSWVDTVKYNTSMPSGIDVYLRPQI